MNITNLFQLLIEDKSIEHINDTFKGKVPEKTLNSLSSRMKKGKYDKKALAVLKAAQEWDSIWGDYIRDNAGKVYAVLKLMAKGNPKFNPDEVLFEFRNYRHGKEQLGNFWKQKYSEAKSNSDEPVKKNTSPFAKVKQMGDEFLFFPRTDKAINDYGISDNDLEKQWTNLRKISDEMAKKDTTKNPNRYYDDEDDKDPTLNHWCVASSDRSYYEDYKNNGGMFVVVVKKGKDGKPDYNHRYLFYARPETEDDEEENNWEFADKFDDHIEELKDVLSEPTANFLYDIKRNIKYNKSAHNKMEVNERLSKALNDEWNDKSRENSQDTKNLRKLIKFLNDKYAGEPITQGQVSDAVSKLPLSSFEEFKDFYENGKRVPGAYVLGGRGGDILIGDFGIIMFGRNGLTMIVDKKTGVDVMSYRCDGDLEIIYHWLKKVARSKYRDAVIMKRNNYSKTDEHKWDGLIFPFNSKHKSLMGNEKLEKAYKKTYHSLPVGTCLIQDKLRLNRNTEKEKYELIDDNNHQFICNLDDPDMIKKVAKYLGVAEGKKNV